MTFEKPSEKLTDEACDKTRQAFIDCVIEYSECIHKGGEFNDCLGKKDFPNECQDIRRRLFNCRRSMVDARSRLKKN